MITMRSAFGALMGAGVRPWIGFDIPIGEEIPHGGGSLHVEGCCGADASTAGSYGRSMRRGVSGDSLGSPTFLLS